MQQEYITLIFNCLGFVVMGFILGIGVALYKILSRLEQQLKQMEDQAL